ncbi:DYW domain [Dillenia turbinata]|uniref:DYW domain n=1 Tax=Dillenia turbinata TaxID=194707 RepID=A0AAN8VDY0_9MAGN
MNRGFCSHGFGTMALDTFKKMRHESVAPDNVLLVVTMSACSHVRLVEEGYKLFRSMVEDYNVEPKFEHYGCLVDLLGRAGRLEEAREVIRAMPMKPDAVVWKAVLGSARVHGDIEIGEQALEHLIPLEPEISGNYVLLSNLSASSHRLDSVRRVRKLMKDQGITKALGNSLEDKENAIGYHGERLAIAVALTATDSSRAPIKIIKNLPVCYDCHESTKLILMIYEREIIVETGPGFIISKMGAFHLDYWEQYFAYPTFLLLLISCCRKDQAHFFESVVLISFCKS